MVKRINKFINNRILNLILKIILLLSSISLIGTAFITMKYGLAHKIFALSFFLSYNFFVFFLDYSCHSHKLDKVSSPLLLEV